MDWLPAFLNKNQKAITSSGAGEYDPQACYDSFKEHWQQAYKILQRVQHQPGHDDVLGVVNHLEQIVTLLGYDIKKNDYDIHASHLSVSKCLEYLLTENILDKLFDWSIRSGKYTNALICEQLKLYGMLVNQTRDVLFSHQTFVKPLVKLLSSCQGQLFSKEIEKLLVDLLYQLSALLMQNIDFIDFFFEQHNHIHRFIIFPLLLFFVHREDSIGMKARDALLLCMTLSKKNKNVTMYIADHTDFSILVGSGLSGLYSALPVVINDIEVPDWHRFTPDDVNDIKGLLTFITSLEFSNAVAQVAHPIIRKQLQEFFYRGFLIPVLGPALLQVNIEEQVAASAYFELILRTVTQSGLLYSLLQFLFKDYFGNMLLNILIQRIDSSDSQLCLVTLAVFESLIGLNCEDLMLELVFKPLQPCLHLMVSQRKLLLPIDPHCHSFTKLLSLKPKCCENKDIPNDHHKFKQSLYGNYHAYLYVARTKIERCQIDCTKWTNSYTGAEDFESTNSENSLDNSSDYGSFVTTSGEVKPLEASNKTTNSKKNATSTNDEQLNSLATVGPFLTILLNKLRNFLSNSIYINLHLTGLISRLAVYPQPLLRAYLLDHSLVLQPNVPSIFEILGLLRHQIDEYIYRQPDRLNLIKSAKEGFIDRELMLLNLRRHNSDSGPPQTSHKVETNNEPFQRNGSKRRSITSLAATVFSRRPSQMESSNTALPPTPENIQLKSIYPKYNEGQHVALCAVLLDEWVQELAALAQEHTIAQITTSLLA